PARSPCCLIDTNEAGVKNTSTLQGSTSALSRTAPDTKGKTGGKEACPPFRTTVSPRNLQRPKIPLEPRSCPKTCPTADHKTEKRNQARLNSSPGSPAWSDKRVWIMRTGGMSQRRSARSVTSDPRRRGVGCPVC